MKKPKLLRRWDGKVWVWSPQDPSLSFQENSKPHRLPRSEFDRLGGSFCIYSGADVFRMFGTRQEAIDAFSEIRQNSS